MALFFDSEWFDARLAASHLSRADVARALGVTAAQAADIWKDQRELSARDVSTLAVLLASPPEEIAQRAGISTPIPKTQNAQPSLADLAARLERVEAELAALKARLETGV